MGWPAIWARVFMASLLQRRRPSPRWQPIPRLPAPKLARTPARFTTARPRPSMARRTAVPGDLRMAAAPFGQAPSHGCGTLQLYPGSAAVQGRHDILKEPSVRYEIGYQPSYSLAIVQLEQGETIRCES